MIAAQTEWDLDHMPSDPPHASLADELPADVLAIIGHLSRHCRGPQNAATAASIAAALGIGGKDPARYVRSLISGHKHCFPFPVVGKGGAGFFISEDPDELTHYDRTLHALLVSVARSLSATRRNFQRNGYVRTGTGPLATWQPRQLADGKKVQYSNHSLVSASGLRNNTLNKGGTDPQKG